MPPYQRRRPTKLADQDGERLSDRIHGGPEVPFPAALLGPIIKLLLDDFVQDAIPTSMALSAVLCALAGIIGGGVRIMYEPGGPTCYTETAGLNMMILAPPSYRKSYLIRLVTKSLHAAQERIQVRGNLINVSPK